ncbi:MAG: hypothetical protein H0W24_05835 [Lysobacter sp.]|nr:hypothetical protein [Lysobacter sp.]MDQ3270149.1 hypothetical protein [Pseudomonadota bacterium]
MRNNPQTADSSACGNLGLLMLGTSEPGSNLSNTTGNPHDEDFLDVRGY